jgi:hypothetical protein
VVATSLHASPRLDTARVHAIVSELGLTVPKEMLSSNGTT